MAAKRTAKKTLYRVNESLSGKDLWAYTWAIFNVVGMVGKSAKGATPGDLSAFYNSPSVVRHHTGNKNFGRKDGRVILTAKGKAHFAGRLSEDSAQFVEKSEAAAIAKALRSGKDSDLPEIWQGAVTLSPVELKG